MTTQQAGTLRKAAAHESYRQFMDKAESEYFARFHEEAMERNFSRKRRLAEAQKKARG